MIENMQKTPDYLTIYDLEGYLFNEVGPRFAQTGVIDLIDFYMIAIWKAPRAKSYARRKLKRIGNGNCAEAVKKISQALWNNKRSEDRLRILRNEFEFGLATASAILTVLDPNNFTVYDTRVCRQLGDFEKLSNRKFSKEFWEDYQRFIEAVKAAVPKEYSLRNKDRYLWGKSFYEDAKEELEW